MPKRAEAWTVWQFKGGLARKMGWDWYPNVHYTQNFLSHLQFFKVSKIMVSKYGYLMLPGAFPDIESYPWYWFYRWSNNSVLSSSCKNTFVGAGNLQVITINLWCENLWGPYVLHLDAVLCIYSFSFWRRWSI